MWGAQVSDRWYAEGGPTRSKLNLGQNPRMAIHVGFGDEVIIVEGSGKCGLSDVPFLTHRRSQILGTSGLTVAGQTHSRQD